MQILMPRFSDQFALAPTYARELAALGHAIRFYSTERRFSSGIRRSADALARRIWEPVSRTTVRSLRREVAAAVPDVVWIFKGMGIPAAVIDEIKRSGAKVANYNPDHPFSFFARATGDDHVRESVAHFDLYLTYSRKIENEISWAHPSLETAIVPFGHDVSEDFYSNLVGSTEEICSVAFVGTLDRDRLSDIEFLAAGGFPVDVYAPRIPRRLQKIQNVSTHQPVRGRDMYATLRKHRVALNFFRPQNIQSHNMRSFEIPAAGGIMLAPDSEEHREFFDEGNEAFFFKDRREITDLVENLLSMSSGAAASLRANARQRSVESGYHYGRRAADTAAIFESLHKTGPIF